MDYDKQLNELEEIIEKLESGEIGFDEAVKMFERGAEICKNLSKSFDEAKGKVSIIREELMGILKEEQFQPEE